MSVRVLLMSLSSYRHCSSGLLILLVTNRIKIKQIILIVVVVLLAVDILVVKVRYGKRGFV